jgi:AcrR family transcriptional regulator
MEIPVKLPPAPSPDPYADPLSLAVVDEVFEREERADVAGLIARAGIPASDFYARYTTLEDCALDSFERFIAAYERRVGMAFNAPSDWRSSLRAAAYESADFIEENRALAHFGVAGVLQLNSELLRVRREEVIVFCGGLIDLGRTEPSDVEPEPGAAMFAVGSIIQLLTYRLQSDGLVEPHAIVPEMMYAVVRTYKGEEVAREELELSRPALIERRPERP